MASRLLAAALDAAARARSRSLASLDSSFFCRLMACSRAAWASASGSSHFDRLEVDAVGRRSCQRAQLERVVVSGAGRELTFWRGCGAHRVVGEWQARGELELGRLN